MIRGPIRPAATIEDALNNNWCGRCPECCAGDFNPYEMAEFFGRRGINAIIMETEAGTALHFLTPMTRIRFSTLLRRFVLNQVEKAILAKKEKEGEG